MSGIYLLPGGSARCSRQVPFPVLPGRLPAAAASEITWSARCSHHRRGKTEPALDPLTELLVNQCPRTPPLCHRAPWARRRTLVGACGRSASYCIVLLVLHRSASLVAAADRKKYLISAITPAALGGAPRPRGGEGARARRRRARPPWVPPRRRRPRPPTSSSSSGINSLLRHLTFTARAVLPGPRS
jgi:hypothetical protein